MGADSRELNRIADVAVETKKSLRSALRAAREGIPAGLRCFKSERILERLVRRSEYRSAKNPAFTFSHVGEVDTAPLLRKRAECGEPVLLPLTRGKGEMQFHRVASLDTLTPSRFGILEPDPSLDPIVPMEEIDLVVLPGVGFDPRGNRLGQGGGYFDRFLSRLPAKVPRIGLAFDRQILERIPTDSHDQPVDLVLTERTQYQIQDLEWHSDCVQETHELAGQVAACLSPPCLIRLSGELGSGKTEWVRGFLHALGWRDRVKSPTFTLENVYNLGAGITVVHLDGYRLNSPSSLDLDRFEEILDDPESIVLVEWPERFGPEISPFSPHLHLTRCGGNERHLTWQACEVRHHLSA